jgi:membrane protein YqaA with SNARE-associated domain
MGAFAWHDWLLQDSWSACYWGIGEATLFFIVPDVYLTFLAVQGAPVAWVGCVAAVAGALVGGAIMYRWGARDAVGAQAVLKRLPAIDDVEVARVHQRVESSGFGSIFLGPLFGTPYKIYAVEAGSRGMSFAAFLLVTVPARGVRFAAATSIALWLVGGPLVEWTGGSQMTLAAAFWIVLYSVYFRVKGF